MSACERPGCSNPKLPGRGQQLCAEHHGKAASERDQRRRAKREASRRLTCQFGDCTEPKLRGQGQRYCEQHSAETLRREVENSGLRNRTRRSGLTPEQYAALLEAQGGVCAICGEPPGRRQLSVDHTHGCCSAGRNSCGKCRRGLLCDRCNPLLGYAQDSIEVLEAAIAYLKQYLPIS